MFNEGDVVVYVPSRRVLVVRSNQTFPGSVQCRRLDDSDSPSTVVQLDPANLIRVSSEEEGFEYAKFLLDSTFPSTRFTK